MLPGTRRASPAAGSFALRLAAWSLTLFALFRLPWVAAHILLPATQVQAAAGAALLGPSSLPIEATLACSGADALALCLAAIVAYPAAWRMRGVGVAVGAAAVVALNTMRIGTLGRAAASPAWFNLLHVYVWPAALSIAIAAIVFTWMRAADGSTRIGSGVDRQQALGAVSSRRRPADVAPRVTSPLVSLRFALIAVAGLVLFTIASPLYLESPRVLALAVLVARAAAALLRAVGVDATAGAGVLSTPAGAFLVTQECISTPLIPVYLAAVLVYVRPWWRAALSVAAGVPLFLALGIARLLVVAVPAGFDRPPAFFIHAFSQLLVAAAMVCAAAWWRHGAGARTCGRIVIAVAIAVAWLELIGPAYTSLMVRVTGVPPADPQGALLFLPAFQAGLFIALWCAAFIESGWRRFLCGAALLASVQIVVNGGVNLLASHAGLAPLVRDVRAWALIGPALVIAMVIHVAPARR